MGFNDAMSGYKKLKNTANYTNQTLLELIKDTHFSCGTPSIGVVAKKESIVFPLIGDFTVYIQASEKSIEIARVVTKGTLKYVLKELLASFFTDANNNAQATADRAVDEVYDVINRLLETGVVENKSGGPVLKKLYMKQKLISIKDKFNIWDENNAPVYWVDGNLLSLGYKIEDADNNLLYEIKKKVIAMMPEFSLLQNGEEIGKVKKLIKLSRPVIEGSVNNKKLTIKGDLSGFHYAVFIDEEEIGSIDTERFTVGDVYSIGIKNLDMEAFVVTIAIIIDNILE